MIFHITPLKDMLWPLIRTVSLRLFQGLTNPVSGCSGQVKIFAGQVKKFLTCPEKCINYIGKTKEFQGFLAEAIRRTSGSGIDLSSPAVLMSGHNISIC